MLVRDEVRDCEVKEEQDVSSMFITHKSHNDGRVINPSEYTSTLHREASV